MIPTEHVETELTTEEVEFRTSVMPTESVETELTTEEQPPKG